MTEAELDVIHERLRQDINATADRRFLLAEVDRLTAEIQEWRERWTNESRERIILKAKVKRLEGRE